MIRARFHANPDDPRPVVCPIPHPYWVTGYGDDHSIIVAYADDVAQIKQQWPDATHIDAEPAETYVFTSRFQKPTWFRDAHG